MINTLNESQLHKALKSLYAIQNRNSKTEVEFGPYIVDIMEENGTIIEIQTASLSHLLAKLNYCISKNRKVIVVHPIFSEKYIETYSQNGKLISSRKSPQKKNIYGEFRELTKLSKLLLNPLLQIDFVNCAIIEVRTTTDSPVQSKNGRRRVKKAWLKTEKKLKTLYNTSIFNSPQSYLSLLPESCRKTFIIKKIYSDLKKEGEKISEQDVRFYVWVLTKAGILSVNKENKTYVYTVCDF